MIDVLRDLVSHKGHANAAMLAAVAACPAAVADADVSALLHHVLLANRFWLLAIVGAPFDREAESRPAASFDVLVQRYAETQAAEEAWLAAATVADLARRLSHPLVPGGGCAVSDAFLQVCLHSHGHRAQCATLLRGCGGAPPPMDYVLWAGERPQAVWPAGA